MKDRQLEQIQKLLENQSYNDSELNWLVKECLNNIHKIRHENNQQTFFIIVLMAFNFVQIILHFAL